MPDLILCDIMMPGMDGEALCHAIRADPEVACLPVIMVTAKASRQSRLSALEGGADDHLVKPFEPEELELRVANALDSRRRFAERLRAEDSVAPLLPLELPGSPSARSFVSSLEGVLHACSGNEDFDVDEMADALAMPATPAQQGRGRAPDKVARRGAHRPISRAGRPCIARRTRSSARPPRSCSGRSASSRPCTGCASAFPSQPG